MEFCWQIVQTFMNAAAGNLSVWYKVAENCNENLFG